ncbi:MAG: cytochrome c oxidase accessory protein CcoG [Rhodobiaceae bacterium]|nr:cytochrome c oxidase accessory protein CcoG [Rhodobiaceae bacterium]MCC0040557.1 cytochrome c oxidase accessory protein CcoG [Rhodobiaceae bacterium]MCC0054030.1 cytochrome c oxidase accessory protein CcoG [Rhodobiaceae bacterium]
MPPTETQDAQAISPTSENAPTILYAARKKVYPQSVRGTFRSLKWTFMALALGVYYLLPFVRWDRGPNAPDQAVLVDFPARRFYFFFIEIWPQEVYYLTGLLILAAMALFLMNALAGRLWCGYMCPQTVWTDLFYAVERLMEGDRRTRMRLDKEGWSLHKFGERAAKHALWLIIAWWTGGAWVLYFSDAPTLVQQLLRGEAPFTAYLWIGILTATTYVFAGHMREQVCVYMCPWPRIQAALTDEWALNVTYLRDRGEPRMSVKDAKKAEKAGERAGDCVDCLQCVAVCPTGIDIRDGAQLECIQCGLCIDACNAVMDKIGRPRGLVAYDNDINMARREAGEKPVYRPVRARTIIYTVIIIAVAAIMAVALFNRTTTGISVIHGRNPLYVTLQDGSIYNSYTARLINKELVERSFAISVDGLAGARVEAVGVKPDADGHPIVVVGPDKTHEVRLVVYAPAGADLPENTPITFRVVDLASGEEDVTSDNFKAPAK